jgi:hypothetical protein
MQRALHPLQATRSDPRVVADDLAVDRIGAASTLRRGRKRYVIRNVLHRPMPRLVVRRTGNSLGLPIPRDIVRDLGLAPGDELMVHIDRIAPLTSLAGVLKGRITADEFTRLSNEGEDLG